MYYFIHRTHKGNVSNFSSSNLFFFFELVLVVHRSELIFGVTESVVD